MVVTIKVSKTNPFRRGVSFYLGRTNTEILPVAAILAQWGEKGPFFTFEDGRMLTRERFVGVIRKVLTKLGMDCSPYVRHNFHIGAATTAARNGVQDSLIRTDGRVQHMCKLYIRTPPEVLRGVTQTMVAGSGGWNSGTV